MTFNQFFTAWRNSFRPLRLTTFRYFLGGQFISLTGTLLQSTAQSLLVYQLSHGSATALGAVAFATALPSLLFSLWVGPLINRFERRKLIISVQVGEMMLAFLLGWLVKTEQTQLWHVYGLAFALGTLETLIFPAQGALLAQIVGVSEVRDSINLGAMAHNLSRAIGPAIAGFAIGAYGLAITFWLNGLSFLAVIASILVIRVAQQAAAEQSKLSNKPLAALKFIRQNKSVRDVLLAFGLLAAFGQSTYALVPAIVRGNVEQTGLLLGAAGAGSLFSVLFVMPFINRFPRMGLALSGGDIWMGIWLMVLSQSQWFPLSLLAMFLAGTATTVVWDGALGLVQVLSPETIRAQMLSIFGLMSFGLLPIAALLLGFVADQITTMWAIFLSGLGMAIFSGLMLVQRQWRNWETQPPQPEQQKLHGEAAQPFV